MRSQQYIRWTLQILLLNFVFLIVGFFWRLAFLRAYGDSYELDKLVKPFLLGSRFDLTVLCYMNAIPLLLFFIFAVVFKNQSAKSWGAKVTPWVPLFLATYFTIFLCLINAINIIDLKYYSFYQDRLNVLIFGFITDDTIALIKTMWKNYPIVWLFGTLFFCTWMLYKLLRRFFRIQPPKTNEKNLSWPLAIAFFFCLFFLNGVGARGSLGLFPLSEMDTNISGDAFLNQLCFNSARALSRAIELKNMQNSNWDSNLHAYGYGDNYRQAFADYFRIPLDKVPDNPLDLLKQKTAKNEWAEKTQPHVLLFVMESFGSYWLKFNTPEFDLMGDLQRHFDEDQHLENFMSSSGATIGSLSSLMIGSTQRPISEFLTESDYMQVPFRTSPARIYKAAGYKTRFVYGGNAGWREIDKFARFQAFDTVEGEVDITKKLGELKERHDWGVFDEDVFEYIWQGLEQAKGPQFIMTMTTTNHPPYQLPSTYERPTLTIPPALQKRLIGDSALPAKRFATYRYSSQKLAEFLTRLKNSPLKDKVIVAVTGDHTFWIVNFAEDELLQKSAVPFYIYTPEAARKKLDPKTFGSHPDIIPTLYNLSLSSTVYHSAAQDLFAKGPHYALDRSGLIADASGAVMLGGTKSHYYGWEGDFEKLIPAIANPSSEAMALHYKSLMGVLDYYMMSEKKATKSESTPHAHSGR